MLSNTSKYAIRAVIYLAVYSNDSKKIGIKKISKELNIPSPFLSKILQILVRRKLLSSIKGPHGGFGLGKQAKDISLYDIIIEMDGDDLFNTCLLGTGRCNEEDGKKKFCAIHSEFEKVRKRMIELYKNITIDKLAKNVIDNIDDIIL
jgi:Rrf2 family protein